MDLNKLYNIADRENVDIYNFKMNKTKARIISNNGVHILIDYSQLYNSLEEKCIISEELWALFLSCLLFFIFFTNFNRKTRI